MPSALQEVLSSEAVVSDRMQASVRSRPLFNEVPVESEIGTALVTNSSARFVSTKRSPTRGVIRYAFSRVNSDEEDSLLIELYMTLLSRSWSEKWTNRCNNIRDAVSRMFKNSLEPSFLILPKESFEDPQVPGLKVLPSSLPLGCALLTTVRSLTGSYTRIGDYLGVMILRADRAWMVVGDEVA